MPRVTKKDKVLAALKYDLEKRTKLFMLSSLLEEDESSNNHVEDDKDDN